ncbi:helix-turn-helix transcriptional regulator [Acinetobacter calcoaceticus]|uniref:helix-turn-helix transcriptional regulator n=1 Tax=Acinetobacter calcoaceticus TaxID=471 RepID=UPI000B1AA17A|nr:helix-turn-helix transcriptional regulator [Acinetobacter calcoaceticus]
MLKIGSLNQSLKETQNMRAVPLRLTKNEVCKLLGVSRDKLSRMEREDDSFPKSIKEGVTRQAAVYYDHQEILEWYENWKSMMRTVAYS